MGDKPYRGVVVPMVTPVTGEGELDEAATRRVIDHLLDGGIDGVFVLGTTGEAASVPRAARLRLVELTVEQVAGRATTYAGISDNCLAHAVEAGTEYCRLGVDAVVAHLPSYYALNPDEQGDYYAALADRVPGPLVLYNIPSTTHMSIPIDVVEALSDHPKVIGLKDSQNDASRLDAVLQRLGGRADFAVLVGVTTLSAKALALGADGFVPSVGNLVPDLCQQLYECGVRGDASAAARMQQVVNQATGVYRAGRTLTQSLGALKAAMGALSLCGPDVLPPLRPLDSAEQETVRSEYRRWRAGQRESGV
jgi:4-hydroxy-tetrahydrodipicolinate synthase